MALPQIPTTAEVKARVVLRPEQIDPLYGGVGATLTQANTAYEADIASRIVVQTAIAEITLGQWFTEAEITAFTGNKATVSEEAVLLLTLGSLLKSGGQLSDTYEKEGDAKTAEGMALLMALGNAKSDTTTLELGTLIAPRTHGGTMDILWP